jgi:hypothetical protein
VEAAKGTEMKLYEISGTKLRGTYFIKNPILEFYAATNSNS